MKSIMIHQTIILFTLPLFTLLLALSSCTSEKCEFDKADRKYLIGQYDSLSFLENGTDTLKLKVTTEVRASYFKHGWITADKFEDGVSSIYIKTKGIEFRVSVDSCSDLITITVFGDRTYHYYLPKNSVSNKEMIINKYKYKNCFIFNDTIKSNIKECIYTNEFGVVKLEFKDGYLLELLHETE